MSGYRPNQLTAYLFDLANCFSTFYEKCRVLKAETPELRDSRLLLCDLTADDPEGVGIAGDWSGGEDVGHLIASSPYSGMNL